MSWNAFEHGGAASGLKQWAVVDVGAEIHITPVDDTMEHDQDVRCRCSPSIEHIETISGEGLIKVTHSAADGRDPWRD